MEKPPSNLRQSSRRFCSPSSSVGDSIRVPTPSIRFKSAEAFCLTAVACYDSIVRQKLGLHKPGKQTLACSIITMVPPSAALSGGNTSADPYPILIKTFVMLPRVDSRFLSGTVKESKPITTHKYDVLTLFLRSAGRRVIISGRSRVGRGILGDRIFRSGISVVLGLCWRDGSGRGGLSVLRGGVRGRVRTAQGRNGSGGKRRSWVL